MLLKESSHIASVLDLRTIKKINKKLLNLKLSTRTKLKIVSAKGETVVSERRVLGDGSASRVLQGRPRVPERPRLYGAADGSILNGAKNKDNIR